MRRWRPGTREPALVLVGTYGVKRELHPALRQIYRDYDRQQLHEAARQRILSRTPLDTTGMEQVHRPWVLDPGDIHLDVAAVAAGLDAVVTDDVRAIAAHPERPYRVIRADEFLCEQTEDWTDEDFGAALDHYGMHRAKAARKIGVEPASGSASHLLRRSHARHFAKRVMRAARRLGR